MKTATPTKEKAQVSAREMNEAAALIKEYGLNELAKDCRKKSVEAAMKTKGILFVEKDGPVMRVIQDIRDARS
jgi:hypothetical protein